MVLLNIFRTVVFWFIFLLSVVIITLFARAERACQSALKFCSKIALFFSFTKVKITGLENISGNSGYIIAANHGSFIDNIILLAKLPFLFKFIAYPSGFKLPIIGRLYQQAGYIGSGFKNEEAVLHAQKLHKALKQKENLLFFSDMTPSAEVGDFNKSVIKLSKDFNIRILPVVLKGSSKVMPYRKLSFKSLDSIKMHFGEPGYFKDINELSLHFEELYNKI